MTTDPVMRTYEGVIDSIRHMLLTGEVSPGDRLPSERELADALGVSRPMVREALRTLEVLGVVAARRGQGPAAGTFILTEPSPALATLLDMEFTLERFDLADVIDTRVMLERWAITGMPADADLSPAAHALTMMGEPLDREALMEWDLTFHQAIVDCASNRLVAHLYRSLRGSMHQRLADSLVAVDAQSWATFWRRVMREHRMIYAALDSGDRERAADLSEQHVTRHYLRRT
jgi:GntR family transcriptional repressor for pyruvate dehydrogenase complex